MRRGPILVVDDDDDARESFVQLLAAEGWPAVGAHDVAAAIEALARERPTAVLLDGWIGAGTGAPVLEAARERPERPAVILVSGAWGHDPAVAAMAHAADGVLHKPFDWAALAALLAELGVARGTAP